MTERPKRTFEEARDFAGAEWQDLKPESRKRLLRAHGLSTVFIYHQWRQLPPTVQKSLAQSVMERQEALAA